jgi:proton-translocating NADH-quinone oxidoreductase chain M
MYLIIGIWGSREKKIRAAYLLVFYTICGSILMLVSLVYIYNTKGTLNIEYLTYLNFNFNEQSLLWFAFFLSFASKIPMFPFYIWLPEAHVEAPTIGSVLLAGLLLKLGVFGFLRYSLVLFPEASFFFSPLVYTLALISIIYASLNAIKQTDLKKIIAYSSIAHMNLVVLGIFSYNIGGLEGAILQSISHGFVASALFFLIGILYNRYHSRLLYYYSGLVHIMPLYSAFFLFFTLSNIALPGTSSFIGEFLLLNSVFQINVYCSIFAGLSVVLSGAYSFWLYNRIIFGNFKNDFILCYKDLSLKEIVILMFLIIPSLILGLFPSFFLDYLHLSVLKVYVLSKILFI